MSRVWYQVQQRCPLHLAPPTQQLVCCVHEPGIVIAVKGKETSAGEFVVEDVCFPEMAPQPPLPTIAASGICCCGSNHGAVRDMCAEHSCWGALCRCTDAQYVVLVSGLAFGHPKADPLPVQLLVDFLSGLLGNSTVCVNEHLWILPFEHHARVPCCWHRV